MLRVKPGRNASEKIEPSLLRIHPLPTRFGHMLCWRGKARSNILWLILISSQMISWKFNWPEFSMKMVEFWSFHLTFAILYSILHIFVNKCFWFIKCLKIWSWENQLIRKQYKEFYVHYEAFLIIRWNLIRSVFSIRFVFKLPFYPVTICLSIIDFIVHFRYLIRELIFIEFSIFIFFYFPEIRRESKNLTPGNSVLTRIDMIGWLSCVYRAQPFLRHPELISLVI